MDSFGISLSTPWAYNKHKSWILLLFFIGSEWKWCKETIIIVLINSRITKCALESVRRHPVGSHSQIIHTSCFQLVVPPVGDTVSFTAGCTITYDLQYILRCQIINRILFLYFDTSKLFADGQAWKRVMCYPELQRNKGRSEEEAQMVENTHPGKNRSQPFQCMTLKDQEHVSHKVESWDSFFFFMYWIQDVFAWLCVVEHEKNDKIRLISSCVHTGQNTACWNRDIQRWLRVASYLILYLESVVWFDHSENKMKIKRHFFQPQVRCQLQEDSTSFSLSSPQ